jgi:nucleotide-binding universal stress UspA family protein
MNGPILVATDGTDALLGALRVAKALAERSRSTPIVLSVIEPIMLEGSMLYADAYQLQQFAASCWRTRCARPRRGARRRKSLYSAPGLPGVSPANTSE